MVSELLRVIKGDYPLKQKKWAAERALRYIAENGNGRYANEALRQLVEAGGDIGRKAEALLRQRIEAVIK